MPQAGWRHVCCGVAPVERFVVFAGWFACRRAAGAAKFDGAAIGEDGEPAADDIDQLQEAFVAIVIDHAR